MTEFLVNQASGFEIRLALVQGRQTMLHRCEQHSHRYVLQWKQTERKDEITIHTCTMTMKMKMEKNEKKK